MNYDELGNRCPAVDETETLARLGDIFCPSGGTIFAWMCGNESSMENSTIWRKLKVSGLYTLVWIRSTYDRSIPDKLAVLVSPGGEYICIPLRTLVARCGKIWKI